MSRQNDSAMDIDHATDQSKDARMNESSNITHNPIPPILGSKITYQDVIIIRRTGFLGSLLTVKLRESRNDDNNKSRSPFKSVNWVLLSDIFGDSYREPEPNDLIMPAFQENKDIILRAYSYLIAKKNRMYLEFRREHTNGVFETNEPARFESRYENGVFMTRAARAALKPRRQRLMMKRLRHLIMEDVSGILLLANYHPISSELELYHPESEGLYKGNVTENDIVLWESEEALNTFYEWIKFFDDIGPKFLRVYLPMVKKTKRVADHEHTGPDKKRERADTEAQDEDEPMMDIDHE
ncbi:uncharacterized protein F4807DRAFT_458049 [Annulohypoxylon truncatum]|uniref:uncharacterized protein n=1 Tax=Annulohypoxylon truncatum TaxID=327061 RepID=UPI0020080375|nr:uncharacterized protein F4807DRAFT_458049 [Annulohypoxylon truncatum]KAI1211843.1 hypothetical protein F4807DRAFT_458049 [Annulohypoxylon truncatum]